jgi:hypothetical protein
MAMQDPVLTKPLQSTLRQRDITIFTAFATTDVDQPARAVDVRDLKVGPLLKAQTTGVDRR